MSVKSGNTRIHSLIAKGKPFTGKILRDALLEAAKPPVAGAGLSHRSAP